MPEGYRPARHPLQCHQLGRPRHPRSWSYGQSTHRSAHRRDRQGLGPAGRAQGAPGHADLRGSGRRQSGRQGRRQRPRPGLHHPPARTGRPRGPATPWASPSRSNLGALDPRPHLGDGLPGAAREADRRQDRPLRRLWRKTSATGTASSSTGCTPTCPLGARARRSLAAKAARAAAERLRFVHRTTTRGPSGPTPSRPALSIGRWPSSTIAELDLIDGGAQGRHRPVRRKGVALPGEALKR